MNPMACRGLAPLALYGLKVLLTFGGIQIFLSVSSVLCIQKKAQVIFGIQKISNTK